MFSSLNDAKNVVSSHCISQPSPPPPTPTQLGEEPEEDGNVVVVPHGEPPEELPQQEHPLLLLHTLLHLLPLCHTNICALLDNLSHDANPQLSVTKLSNIFLNLTKLFVTQSFAIASSVTYSEIRQKFIIMWAVYLYFVTVRLLVVLDVDL